MGFDKRRMIVVVFAILIGLVCGGVGYFSFNKQLNSVGTTINIAVPKKDIAANTVIKEEDLEVLAVPPSIVDQYTATQSQELVHMVAGVSLYKGKPIDKRSVKQSSLNMQGKGVVGVNIDPARSAGVVEGDVVDVYWLNNHVSTENNPASLQTNVPIARNAIVLQICDAKGSPLNGSSSIQKGVATVSKAPIEPKVVYLIISQAEVTQVISGAAPSNTNIALVKVSPDNTVEKTVQEDGYETMEE